MAATAQDILQNLWGYEKFRPLQKEIIDTVLAGSDAVAILPTGGGKSLCYQIPALVNDGLCIVVSPLIALMQDQVKQLRAKNVKATMVTSGMSSRQIDHAYGNCIHGGYKLLYISPERLQNKTFLARLQEMNVNLIAVDEAHCISQWGYDFRPTYLEIAALREWVKAPIIALTATATPQVVKDVQEKLDLQDAIIFQASVVRKNLSFQVRKIADKFPKLVEIVSHIKGSSIVYTMSRKSTSLIAKELQNQGFSAASYHAGLSHDERKKRQSQWLDGDIRIMVSTNAFGMGIDKSNVRSVIHYHAPESIEAYYQEAGRAGRDGKNSIAMLLFNQKDSERFNESSENRYPSEQVLKRILMGLFQYLKINYGDGPGKPHPFNIYQFAKKYDLPVRLCHNAIESLTRQGWIELSDPYYSPSRFHFSISNQQLYGFQVNHPKYETLVKYMLRNFTGIFEQTVKIDEEEIAKYTKLNVDEVRRQLTYMNNNGIGRYYEQNENPLLTFLHVRPKGDYFHFNKEQLNFLRQRHQEKIQSVISYVDLVANDCRMVSLQKYFGEELNDKCSVCDHCLAERKNKESQLESKAKQIVDLLVKSPINNKEIYKVAGGKKDLVQQALQQLLEEEIIELKDNLWQRR